MNYKNCSSRCESESGERDDFLGFCWERKRKKMGKMEVVFVNTCIVLCEPMDM